MTSVSRFLDSAFADGPKLIAGFSRPLRHNLAGLLYGRRRDKAAWGGMLRHSEAGMLYRWARHLPPGATVLEIGCYGGLSTSYLAAGLRGRPGSRVFSVDPFASDPSLQAERSDGCVSLAEKPSRQEVERRLARAGLAHLVVLIEGWSQELARRWKRPIDFLWIDGNHDRTYRDYADFARFLGPGARVAVHDAHPRYGLLRVAQDARRIFARDEDWRDLEHVKSIISGVRR